jgi:hypothetical protein
LGVDKAFDTIRSPIEAARQMSYLIVTFHLDAGRQVSSAERLYPLLQPFEPARHTTGHGIGAQRDRNG